MIVINLREKKKKEDASRKLSGWDFNLGCECCKQQPNPAFSFLTVHKAELALSAFQFGPHPNLFGPGNGSLEELKKPTLGGQKTSAAGVSTELGWGW